MLRRFLPHLFVCSCAACCCCCCHHGAPVLIFLRFSTDSSPPQNLYGASQMMSTEPSVPTTRKKIASPTACPRFCNMRTVRSVLTIHRLMQFSRMRTMAIHTPTHTDRWKALDHASSTVQIPSVWLLRFADHLSFFSHETRSSTFESQCCGSFFIFFTRHTVVNVPAQT